MPDEIQQAIVENATGPKKVQNDQISVEQHGLPDQVKADQYLREVGAVKKPHRGIRFTKLISPGTV